MNPRHAAVLWGGPSAESEVSASSADGVARALRTRMARVDLIEVNADLPAALAAAAPDVVFPATHGPPGEDGTLQGLLDLLGYAYVGSGVEASAVAMNKPLAKRVFAAAGLPLAMGHVVARGTQVHDALRAVVEALGSSRSVVKPARQGSAIGVGIVDDEHQLADALQAALALNDDVLVEQRIDGAEITAGVLDLEGEPARALPVVQIETPDASWYDYEHRYTVGGSEHLIPAPQPHALLEQVAAIALAAHQALGCRDLSRADFVLGADGPVLLEVNTLPGMTPTSLYPDAAAAIGVDFAELAWRLCVSATRRGPRRFQTTR